jgi:hypothetical protein
MPTSKLVASFLAAAAWVIAACVGCGESTRLDMSLLTGEPCEPPCWQGLVPGVSTLEEVDQVLTGSEYVAPGSIYKDWYGDILSVLWRPRWQSPADNRFVLRGNVLQHMKMYVEPEVTLGQVVDKWGPPDKFQAGRSLHPEPVYIAVDLFYRELGMMVELRLPEDDRQLTPDEEIVRVHYFEPAPLEEVLVTLVWGEGQPPTEEQREVLELWLAGWHDWQGYGTVELTYHFGEE